MAAVAPFRAAKFLTFFPLKFGTGRIGPRDNPVMNFSALLPIIAMAGVGTVLLLTRISAGVMRMNKATRSGVLALVIAVFATCCAAAAGTAFQIGRIGLAGTPPPTMFGTAGRLVGVVIAIALWPMARRNIERATLLTFVVGAGASALIGLGLRSSILDAARVVYHLFMFACGAILVAGSATGLAAGATSRERVVSTQGRGAPHTPR